MSRHPFRGAILLSIVACLSCHADRTRDCDDATECSLDGVDGQCVPAASGSSWCAFPDGTCGVDGLRYGPLSGDGLAGTCVEIERHTLMTMLVGMGSVASDEPGIDCGDDCVEDYAVGTNVMLTATAASGWTFVGWSGDCTGRDPCSVTMDAPHNVTATFEEGYELSVDIVGDGRGRIVANPRVLNCPPDCSYILPAGQPVDVFAVPAAGSRFDGWSGDCTGNTCQVTMDGPRSVTATIVRERAF